MQLNGAQNWGRRRARDKAGLEDYVSSTGGSVAGTGIICRHGRSGGSARDK